MQRYTLTAMPRVQPNTPRPHRESVQMYAAIVCRTRAGVSYGDYGYAGAKRRDNSIASIRAAAREHAGRLRWRNARGHLANSWYAAMRRVA